MKDQLLLNAAGKVPMYWWSHKVNYGDLVGPYIVEKMTGRKAALVEDSSTPHYRVLGPLIRAATPKSILWGAGSWGVEKKKELCKDATYLAVRGPLTRNRLHVSGIACPKIYGDPALLLPYFYKPKPTGKRFKLGVLFRWSEAGWNRAFNVEGVNLINIKTGDIEGVIDQMASCDFIASTSLHAIITADAYGIPNAWLDTTSTRGREFKFWDYFISVNKVDREAQQIDLTAEGLTLNAIMSQLKFADQAISFDPGPLISVNPFGYDPAKLIKVADQGPRTPPTKTTPSL